MLFLDMLVLSTISLFGTIASCFIPSVMDPLKSMIHEQYEKLWMLVDGIYHQLSRIVKPVSDPLVDVEALYSLWQEAKHKDVERFYGVSRRSLTSSQRQFLLLLLRMKLKPSTPALYCTTWQWLSGLAPRILSMKQM
jgi:hypothetical protein